MKQVMFMRDALGKGGRTEFRGYGDLSLTELLPALLTRYSETEMMIVAPSLPDQAAEVVRTWMRRQMARMDGRGTLDYVARMTIVADLSESVSPMASGWLRDNPFGERMVLVDRAQEDTVLLLPDIAITGPVNMRYGHEFECRVTTFQEEVDSLWKQYVKLTRPEKPGKKKAAKARAEEAKDSVPAAAGEKPAEEMKVKTEMTEAAPGESPGAAEEAVE